MRNSHSRPFNFRLTATVSTIALLFSHGTIVAATRHDASEEEVLRVHAARYSDYIGLAYYKLADYIYRKAENTPDWTESDIPPAETGWLDAWTEAGLRARYCEQSLIVYIGEETPKGIYDDQHRRIQSSPANRSTNIQGNKKAPLQWLIDGQIEANVHWEEITLPACLVEAYGKELPSGRAARAGAVTDTNLEKYSLNTYETMVEDCGINEHGSGVTMRRTKSVGKNLKGEEVGEPVYGEWEPAIDGCTDDFTDTENFSVECSWYEGEPHNKTMYGRSFFSRQRTVTASGTTYTDPVFKSSTCWDQSAATAAALLPDPEQNTVDTTESQSASCPAGFTGSITQTRTVSTRTTTFAWNQQPVVSTEYSNWSESSNSCRIISSSYGNGGGGDESVDTDGDGIGDSPAGTPGGQTVSHGCGSCMGPAGPDGGGTGPTIICTYLLENGRLSYSDIKRSLKYNKMHLTQNHMNGYHYWAIPVVKMMQRDDFVGVLMTETWRYIAKARANDIAFVMGERKTADYAGRLVRLIVEPLCAFLGKHVGKQDWQLLGLTILKPNGELSHET